MSSCDSIQGRCFALPGMIETYLEPFLPEEHGNSHCALLPGLEGHAEELAQLCGTSRSPFGQPRISWWTTGTSRWGTACAVSPGRMNGLRSFKTRITPTYVSLSPEMQRLWRILSVFPGGFDSADAAALWDINADAAQDSLSKLLVCSMVQWTEILLPSTGCMNYCACGDPHNALRTSARSAQQKLAEYAATVLARANEMFLRGGESLRQGLDVYERER